MYFQLNLYLFKVTSITSKYIIKYYIYVCSKLNSYYPSSRTFGFLYIIYIIILSAYKYIELEYN